MFILSVILAVIALVLTVLWRKASFEAEVPDTSSNAYGATKTVSTRGPNKVFGFAALVVSIVTIIVFLFSVLYTQSVGQAKVLINVGGTIAGQDATAGVGIKAPWQSVSNWDLFAQNLTFAGNAKGTPKYTGGDINGFEITSSVARGAQTNFDLSITYSLDGEKVSGLYKQFRSQERFTKQIVEPKVLDVVRTIPTSYTPVDFRGEKRGEANSRMFDALNKALNPYGVHVTNVNLQNITYTDEVETSIKQVEVAQQGEAEQQAKLRSATVAAQQQVVEAQAKADAARIAAQGQADANATLAASLTPAILQQRYLDALKNGTVFVVPEGSSPLINVTAPAAQ